MPFRARTHVHQRGHWRPLFRVTIPTLLFWMLAASEASTSEISTSEASAKPSEECENPDQKFVRLVTREELATRNGRDGADIWISIMGEVYDVTMGKEYYAPGASYGAFAGRDASVPFCTGKFNAEESEKSTEVLKSSELPGLANWLDFYRKHKVYTFVGQLIDPRFFDENGEPTSELRTLQMRILIANEEQALKAKIRREKRLQSQQAKASQEKESQVKTSQENASQAKGATAKTAKAKRSTVKVSEVKESEINS